MQTTSRLTPAVLAVALDRSAPEPLHAQLAARVRALVADGTLARGDRLPSSRALSAELGLARSVVNQAYEQLVAEAWLEARRGAGTFVATSGRGARSAPTRPVAPPGTALVRLDTGTPWIDPRHRAGWRRAWREVSAAPPPRGYDDPCGTAELRTAVAERLRRLRGVPCEPDDVVVTHGTTDGLRSLLEVLPAGAVGVEDPGYRATVAAVRALGRTVVDVPAWDVAGQDLAGLAALYVTPAHQHPLGHVMSAADRMTLLDRATSHDVVVVEDDYDSEFRYDVAPVPALAALDRSRVAYLGSASKSVSPSLRLGWMVPPPHLLEPLRALRAVRHDGVSWPVQRAFLSLLRDGYVDQVVRAARRVYAARAPRVAAVMAPHGREAGPSAGMYSTWFLSNERAVAVREALRGHGFDVNLLAEYSRTAAVQGLVIGFGGVTDTELDTALAVVERVLGAPVAS